MNALPEVLAGRTLAVAESVTCGGLQRQIGRISGASAFFLGGLTAYAIEQKVRHLGVDGAAARAVNAVSPEVAAQMARGICALFGSEIGLATTGYAEPNPAWRVAEPFAYWAVARRGAPPQSGAVVVGVGRIDCPGCPRAQAQDRIVEETLQALIAIMRTLDPGP